MAQLAIPICVLLLNVKRKNDDRKAGKVDDKAAINNHAWSVPVILTSNSLENQFQLPVVFYILCLIQLQIGQVAGFFLTLAWVFVLTRWAHAFVHVTTNYIPARMALFGTGGIVLLLMFLQSVWLVAAQ